MQNQIPKNWKKVKLGDLFKVKHGYAFKGEYFSDKGKYVLLTPGNFSEKEGLKFNKVKYYTGQIPPEYMLHKGDLLVVMTDVLQTAPYLGAPGIVDHDNLYLHNQRLGLVTDIDNKKTSKEFLYWLFQTNNIRHQIKGSASGSTVKYTAPERIYSCEAVIPESVDLQKQIAVILSAFDDKIEVNNKIAKTLEQMAQALFKEWFVHFRFPGYEKAEFVDSELGKIPKGWSAGVLEDFIGELESGKRPKGGVSGYKEGTPSIGAENISGLINSDYSDVKYIPTDFFESMNMGKIKDNDILIYKDGGVPGIFKVKFTIVGEGYPFSIAAINEYVFRLQANKSERQFYLYFWLNTHLSIRYFDSIGGKAAVPGINSTDLKNLPLLIPNEDMVVSFNKLAGPLIKKILNVNLQNLVLSKTRDLLLPKLMKGEIRV